MPEKENTPPHLTGINIFLEEKNALISVSFIFCHQFFIPINLSPKGSISEHLIQSNPDFLCQISQRQTFSDRNMSAASGMVIAYWHQVHWFPQ